MNTPLIVVGVDGSEAADRALAWALDEAERRGAEVLAVYAHTTVAPMIPPETLLDLESLEATARDFLDAQVARVAPGDGPVVVRCRVVDGSPPEALIDAARDADLLVVGARGLGGHKGLLLGSVSHQCAQHASCPVVVVHDRTSSVRAPALGATAIASAGA